MGWRTLRKYPLLLAFAVSLALGGDAFGLETITVGRGAITWEGGGGGIAPEFRTKDPTVMSVGNTPGGVIDFKRESGWIWAAQTDPTVNISLGTLERGGSIWSPNVSGVDPAEFEGMVNGDSTVAFARKDTPARKVNPLGVLINLDLGARFGVNRIRFYPRNAGVTGEYDPPVPITPEMPFQNDFLRAYDLLLNDGTPETQFGGFPIWTLVKSEDENTEPVTDIEIPLQYVRWIRIRSTTTIGFEIDEIEVYGTGYVPEALYLSDIFDLGDIATWGKIQWSEKYDGDPYRSRILVYTRSGKDDTPFVYYRIVEGEETPLSKEGQPLTRKDYDKLPAAEKGPIKDDTENWSPWSAPYPAEGGIEGTPIISPAPRRYFQFRIKLLSTDLLAARAVDFLSFTFSKPPVAEELTAEIFPRDVEPGEVKEFTYAVLSTIREGSDTGFDSFEVTTPVRIESVERIEVLDREGKTIAEQVFGEKIDEITMPFKKGDFTIEEVEDDRFVVSFPRITADQTLLKIAFKEIVLRFGTTFTGRAFDSKTEELPQQVVAGNAAKLAPEDADHLSDLSVRIRLGGRLITAAKASPNPFTPNGDNVNDTARISYNILRLTAPAPVRVEVYDLSGRLVRTVYEGNDASGKYSRIWDGTNDAEEIIPPGIYVFRVSVRSDAGMEATAGVVSLSY